MRSNDTHSPIVSSEDERKHTEITEPHDYRIVAIQVMILFVTFVVVNSNLFHNLSWDTD